MSGLPSEIEYQIQTRLEAIRPLMRDPDDRAVRPSDIENIDEIIGLLTRFRVSCNARIVETFLVADSFVFFFDCETTDALNKLCCPDFVIDDVLPMLEKLTSYLTSRPRDEEPHCIDVRLDCELSPALSDVRGRFLN